MSTHLITVVFSIKKKADIDKDLHGNELVPSLTTESLLASRNLVPQCKFQGIFDRKMRVMQIIFACVHGFTAQFVSDLLNHYMRCWK